MGYRVKNLDLTSQILDADAKEVIPKHLRVTEIAILSLPSGVTINLFFGGPGGKDPIAISNPVVFRPTEEDGNDGIYWSNPVATPGVSVKLVVSTSAQPQEVGSREVGTLRGPVSAPGFNHA